MPNKKTGSGKKITKDMTLGELVIKHPEASGVMYNYGLHCIGCHMAAQETIGQGASAHGLGAKDMEKMLKEMNQAASKA
jgi:hybrid cluster-associated redox disulfide protein